MLLACTNNSDRVQQVGRFTDSTSDRNHIGSSSQARAHPKKRRKFSGAFAMAALISPEDLQNLQTLDDLQAWSEASDEAWLAVNTR